MINFFGKKKETAGSVSEAMLDPNNIPRHVAIIQYNHVFAAGHAVCASLDSLGRFVHFTA